jgi:D-galactarolactone cycloisomerase
LDRREFLKLVSAGGAALLAGRLGFSRALAGEPAGRRWTKASAMRALSEHRIAKIEARQLQDNYPRLVGAGAQGGPTGHGGGFQVRILTTDQGAVGWAMAGAGEDEAGKFLGTRISDLFDVETGTADDAPWWFDKLLHDAAGNILGVPVFQLIGGAGPREVPIYSGSIHFEDLLPAEKPSGTTGVLAACKQDYEAGYRAFKVKIGRGFKWMPRADGLRRDIEVTRAVRKEFPDCKLLVDANDGYTPDEAISYVKAVADCNLSWIEEPFEEDRDGLRKLRDAMAQADCRALIADGESRKERAQPRTAYGGYTQQFVDRLYALAADKLVDVFVMDLDIVGFSRWRRAMPELVKAGVLASPHTWMWTPRPYYTAQLAAGVGNVAIVEGIPGGAKGIDYSAYQMKNGKLVMPDVPGFGLRLAP